MMTEVRRMEKNAYCRAWRVEHREEIRVKRHATYLANQEEIKVKRRAYVAAHKDVVYAGQRIYYVAHRAKCVEKSLAYSATHRVSVAATKAAYYASHIEENRLYAKAWSAAHPKERAANWAKYAVSHPLQMATYSKRHMAKRRSLGFIQLNAPFLGCEGHHVDKEQVINMPKKLHHSVYHNQFSGQGMAKINAIAYNFLFKQEVEEALEARRG